VNSLRIGSSRQILRQTNLMALGPTINLRMIAV
jgi:hypothetical protein